MVHSEAHLNRIELNTFPGTLNDRKSGFRTEADELKDKRKPSVQQEKTPQKKEAAICFLMGKVPMFAPRRRKDTGIVVLACTPTCFPRVSMTLNHPSRHS